MIAGLPLYGYAVGILMQRDRIMRLPGDVGNATTFGFPVRYALIEEVKPEDLKNPQKAEFLAEKYVSAARQLESEGVRLLAAGCGFAGILQNVLTGAVRIPVFSSSLIQVPMVARGLGRRRIGIITADSRALNDRYFSPLGWTRDTHDVVIRGIEGETELVSLLYSDLPPDEVLGRGSRIMARIAQDFVLENQDIGAIVLECTNLPPFARVISTATNRPVFDIVTLVKWGYSACIRKPFAGFC